MAMAMAAWRFTITLSIVLALIFTAGFAVADVTVNDEQPIQVEELRSDPQDASLRIELEKLHSKIGILESLADERTSELRSKDEVIGEKEKTIHENLDKIDQLQSKIASLKEKGKLDADAKLGKAYNHVDELEKQVESLKKKIEAKDKETEVFSSQNEEYKANIIELNSKLESLQETVGKHKVQLKKTERALKLAEEELMKTKSEATTRTKELIEVHGAWLPPWLEAQLISYQALVDKHWQQHGKPALQNVIDKAADKKSQAHKWAEPHFEAIRTQWIPAAKEQWIVIVKTVKPRVHSLKTKTFEIYETTKTTVTPHIIKAQEIVDPYYKDVKKFSKPYIDQVATATKPHVEKVHVYLKPYTKKAIRSYHKFLKAASVYHHQVQTKVEETLHKHELTKALTTKELVWFAASAFLALPIIFLWRVFSRLLCKKTKRPPSGKSHARRKGKRGH
ncbi:uncharacterized protein LOC124931867 [Impatiens glandulifera]|uniref:uncharacterized protein LOC124931867 n=1 Tax=Impatiens glandulifera TaxID=253017 RepID=UPI001FB0625A|nr:uncharacterized protein LOC124931867 [Impatiens glandulifera]